MGTSQDLVPTGQPYGERKATVAAMKSANVPLSSGSGGGQAVPPTGSPQPVGASPTAPAPPVSGQSLEGFDVFAGREPDPQFQSNPNLDPVALFQNEVANSPNSAVRYYFGRYQDFLE